MRTLSLRSRALVTSAVLAAWTLIGFACTVEDENPATTRPRGSEAGPDGTTATDDGSVAPTGAPLCGKYGGPAAVSAIADAIVTAAIADCRIGVVVENARNRNNDQQHFDECFQKFVGGGFQCPGVSFSLGQTTDTSGDKCNKQLENVTFSNTDFNAFLQDVSSALKTKGLADDEIRSVAPVFEGARARLVGGNVPANKHTQCRANCTIATEACTPPVVDAGNDTGVTDSGADTGVKDAADQ